MLKLLLKKQLSEIFHAYYYDPKKNKKRSAAATIAYFVLFGLLMIGVLGGMFTFLSYSMCFALHTVGMDFLYFAIMGMLAVVLGAFGSVFNTYSGLYLAHDNDLLLSMPIPVRSIMASRLLSVYLMGLLYSAVVMIPAVVVYLVTARFSVAALIGGIIMTLLVSVFVLVLSCVLGYAVARISLKLKHKSIVTVLISLAFIALYYFCYYKAQSVLENILQNAVIYGAMVKDSAYPLYLFGQVGVGDAKAIAIVGGVIIALFVLTCLVLSRSFLRIATATSSSTKKAYRHERAKVRPVSRALFSKEFSYFLSCPVYILNCAIGSLFLVILGGLGIAKLGTFMPQVSVMLGDMVETVPAVVVGIVCLAASMNTVTSPSVSLEGKSLWILHSLPVKPWQVLRAKLCVHLAVTLVPALFCSVAISVTAGETPVMVILSAAAVLLFVYLTALIGLAIGVMRPNLTWTSEVTPVKQSASVIIAMLLGTLYAVAIGGLIFLCRKVVSPTVYMLAVIAVTAALSIAIRRWISTRGAKLFADL